MKKSQAAVDPEAYVAGLSGWRRSLVERLRTVSRVQKGVEERIKWGHLVYLSNGPAWLVRAEESRVLFGFWRGKRLRDIEPGLKPGGKYEMATLELLEGDAIAMDRAERLVGAAIGLNEALGDPTGIVDRPANARRGKSVR